MACSGKISQAELKSMMQKFGENITDAVCACIVTLTPSDVRAGAG